MLTNLFSLKRVLSRHGISRQPYNVAINNGWKSRKEGQPMQIISNKGLDSVKLHKMVNCSHDQFTYSNSAALFQQIRQFGTGTQLTQEANEKWLKSQFHDLQLKMTNMHTLVCEFVNEYKNEKKKQSPIFTFFTNLFTLIFIVLQNTLLFLNIKDKQVFFFQQEKDKYKVEVQEVDVTFGDVKGLIKQKKELEEAVEFLKKPEKFFVLGAKLPKAILLIGPPHTGKSLLARAVAGEGNVPLFEVSARELNENPERISAIFAAANEKQRCVILIDEMDAIGGERTIYLLCKEIKNRNESVIVIGATNRGDHIDQGLLQHRNFDIVYFNMPKYMERLQFLNKYTSKIKCRDIDVEALARDTITFTAADIEDMVNRAALKAAVDNANFVTMNYLNSACDEVVMRSGTEINPSTTNEIIALYKSAQAIVSYYRHVPMKEVSIIIPRESHKNKEKTLKSKLELLASIEVLIAGRAAEEIIFGSDEITSGASSDLKKATALATYMVKKYGMSERVGLRTVGDNEGGALVHVNDLSQATTEAIDQEIKKILNDSYERAKQLLKTHAKEHKQLAEALLKYETLESDDVIAILSQNTPSSTKTSLLDNP